MDIIIITFLNVDLKNEGNYESDISCQGSRETTQKSSLAIVLVIIIIIIIMRIIRIMRIVKNSLSAPGRLRVIKNLF